jgi:hypothetical protein
MVTIKLILLIIEEAPAKCKAKIAQSTPCLLCPLLDKGGYRVHPVPTLPLFRVAITTIKKAGITVHKDILFIRGKAISGTIVNTGTNIFPNPEIKLGIRKKKIMIIA